MISTRLQAFYNPLIGFLPQVGLAVILFYGGRQVINGDLTAGQFTAFYSYVLMLLSPMRTLGMALGMSQRAVPVAWHSSNSSRGLQTRMPQLVVFMRGRRGHHAEK